MGVQKVPSKGLKKSSERKQNLSSLEKIKLHRKDVSQDLKSPIVKDLKNPIGRDLKNPFAIMRSGPHAKKVGPQDKKRAPKSAEKQKQAVGQSRKGKNNHQNEEKALAKSKASNPSVGAGKKVGNSVLSRGALDQSGETVCREVACEGLATSAGYCRLHYIKNWKKIKRKEVILREKKLNQYIEELIAKYPDKYIEAIRQDLASDKDFAKVIYDLDLDEGMDDFDVEGGEPVDSLIDSIKRDFDDEGDAF